MSTTAGYDADRGHSAFLFDSYWGASKYKAPSSPTMGRSTLTQWRPILGPDGLATADLEEYVVETFASYLVPHPGESPRAFRVRVGLASYVNIVAPIVDAYVDAVTAPTVRDLGALAPYLERLDGRSRGWAEHVEEVARWAAVYGFCATVIEPPRENASTSRADEEARGVGLRATLVHPTAMAWVVVDDDGQLEELAFVDAPYFQAEAGYQTVRFWVYGRDTWALYETVIPTSVLYGSMRPALQAMQPVRSGVHAVPGKVPVVFAYFRQDTSAPTPRGVPLVGDAADLCRQIYNTLSWVEEIHRKTAFPILMIPEPSQGGQLDPGAQRIVGPGLGMGYNSQTGSPAWVQPSAESTKELRDHAVFLAQIALRTTGLEVSSGDTSPDASGEALKVRSRDFDSRCSRFARNLAVFEREALGLAAEMLGLAEPVAPTYPKRFVLPDPSGDLARAILLVQTFGAELGSAGLSAAVRAALDAALSLSDEQLATIMDGISATPQVKPAVPAHQNGAAS